MHFSDKYNFGLKIDKGAVRKIVPKSWSRNNKIHILNSTLNFTIKIDKMRNLRVPVKSKATAIWTNCKCSIDEQLIPITIVQMRKDICMITFLNFFVDKNALMFHED